MTTEFDGLVAKFSAAQVLEQLPAVIDVQLRTPHNPPPEIQQKYVGAYAAAVTSDGFGPVFDPLTKVGIASTRSACAASGQTGTGRNCR